MKLIVNELKTSLFQEITPSKTTQVEAVRINLYKHNNPEINLTIEIHNSNGGLIAASDDSFSSSEISSSPFFHGFIRFKIKAQLMKNTPYRIVLKASGYAFSESAYIGWCSSFDLPVYEPSYETLGNFHSPLALEIWCLS